MTHVSQIVLSANASARIRHAGADLQRYLAMATGSCPTLTSASSLPETGTRFVIGYVEDGALGDALIAQGVPAERQPEGYSLRRVDDLIAVVGADEAGAIYGVYALLEEAYGCGFFLGSEVVPAGSQPLLPENLDRQQAPAFATRGLLPWYDFLSGPTAWNLRDYKLYIDRMVRMGLNFLGLHVYSTDSVNRSGGAEPFLSFTYRGVGHDAFLDTTQTSRWGYQPMRTSEFAYGSGQFFAEEVFGADAAIHARGSLDAIDRGKNLLSEAVRYAKHRGLKVCIGFEPAAIPEEILHALPADAKREMRGHYRPVTQVLDLSSTAAREILHLRLDDLLQTYPDVDAIWLWQNEDAAWTLQHAGTDTYPFDASYLQAAYDYLKDQAPDVQLVVSGWGAVHQLFDQLHQKLPTDVAFSGLNHNLGSSQTDDAYSHLGERDRWPIPWLEDDATLWHPQYYVERFHNDVSRAHEFGANGMIGIHWRTRVIDHTASYFARALWTPELDASTFYDWYARLLVGQEAGPTLAASLAQTDRQQAWPGYLSDTHVGSTAWNGGHSNEAGAAFNPIETPDDVFQTFTDFSDQLEHIAAGLAGAEAERARYHAAQVMFVRHYVVSQREAAAIDRIVAAARDATRKMTPAETRTVDGHLTNLFDAVRQAVEASASVVTTTADLGVLASLSQKYVQRAVWQRVDAVREHAADPDSVPTPDLTPSTIPARLFVPVPPETVDQDGAEIEAVVSVPGVSAVTLHSAPLAGGEARTVSLRNTGRGVWTGSLRASVSVKYWLEAQMETGDILRAPVADDHTFSAVVVMVE